MNYRGLLKLLALVPLLPIVAGGGGINASQTISPATFFLPGLMQVQPEKEKAAPLAWQSPGQPAAPAAAQRL